jgi:hypothetical protein
MTANQNDTELDVEYKSEDEIDLPSATAMDRSENHSRAESEVELDDEELIEEVEDNLKKHLGNAEDDIDEEDAPDWVFEEGELRSRDPEYTFCPAPHRKQILRLFTKHFCKHQLLPEPTGWRTAVEIRTEAVQEMYQFCYQRRLRETWAYLWTYWYSAKMWPLWALSPSELMSRIRITMAVENFWKQLKHDWLHFLIRPRVDQLTYIICTKVVPSYMQRADKLEDTFRLGRSKALTTHQQYLKREWFRLLGKPKSKGKYIVDVVLWLCTCGQQKFHRHLLCNLVAAVPTPSPTFWHEIYRRRTIPFYHHPDLHAIGSVRPKYSNPNNGSITNGDDHLVSGARKLLGGDGAWRDLLEGRASPNSEGEESFKAQA